MSSEDEDFVFEPDHHWSGSENESENEEDEELDLEQNEENYASCKNGMEEVGKIKKSEASLRTLECEVQCGKPLESEKHSNVDDVDNINVILKEEDRLEQSLKTILEHQTAYQFDLKEAELLQICKRIKHLSVDGTNYKPKNIPRLETGSKTIEDIFQNNLMIIKKCINADDAFLYFVKDDKIHRFMDSPCPTLTTGWKIEPGSVVAAYVAYSQKGLMIQQGEFKSKNYPLGMGRKGPDPNSAISVPAMSSDNKVIAVMEFIKRYHGCSFSRNDLHYALTVASWMCVTLTGRDLKQEQIDVKNYNHLLLHYFKCFLKKRITVVEFVSCCILEIKEMLKAQDVSYYSSIAELNPIDAFEFDGKEENKLIRKKRRITPETDDLLLETFKKRETINVTGDNLNEYPNIQETVSGIIYIPVGTPKRSLGVIKLTRTDNTDFTLKDESLAWSCAAYCACSLFYTAIHKQLDSTREAKDRQADNLLFHLAPCPDVWRSFNERSLKKPPPSLATFSWYPGPDDIECLVDYAWWMFNDLFEGDPIMKNLLKYVLMCRKGYRPMPYHNFEHAFSATQAMYCIIKSSKDKFDLLDQQALMVAMLSHDLDHPGLTNNYLKHSSNELAHLYRDSFLENHHSSITKLLIQDTKIFAGLSRHEHTRIMDDIHSLIIATDLKLYFQKVDIIRRLVQENKFCTSNLGHRELLKKLIMTSCDLSGQCKPYKVASRLAFNLYHELYDEGDRLKKLGVKPMPLMDRDNYREIPSDQVHFINVMVMPCTKLLHQILPETKSMYELANGVKDAWVKIKEKKASTPAKLK